jgi:hypothetical protein
MTVGAASQRGVAGRRAGGRGLLLLALLGLGARPGCSARPGRKARLTDEDIQRLEREEDAPEVDPFLGQQMVFVLLHYDGISKEKTAAIIKQWLGLLGSTGVEVNIHALRDDRLLLTCWQMAQIMEFTLSQPETAEVEHNKVKTPGPADGPGHRDRLAAQDAASQAARDQSAAEAAKSKEKSEKRKTKKRSKRTAVKDEV